jgi:hypothetical protein
VATIVRFFSMSEWMKPRPIGAIRVEDEGGYSVVEGKLPDGLRHDLDNFRYRLPPDGQTRGGPEAGALWAKALVIAHTNGYGYATAEVVPDVDTQDGPAG